MKRGWKITIALILYAASMFLDVTMLWIFTNYFLKKYGIEKITYFESWMLALLIMTAQRFLDFKSERNFKKLFNEM